MCDRPRDELLILDRLSTDKPPPLLTSSLMAGRRGRPAKRAKRNITGLRNQSSRAESSPASSPEPPASPESVDDFGDSDTLDVGELNSLMYLEVDSDHDDDDNEADWEEVATEKFQKHLLALIAKIEEDRRDAEDEDWIPSRKAIEIQRAAERRKPGG
ncbi:hypothetical protein FB451DRAFT_1171521 [Mycena latifolia]|nr:hypothetical protein FB451DRAFT_1171521 [Mycena latifolia]